MRKFVCKNCECSVSIENEDFEETIAELWGAENYCSEKCCIEDKMKVFCPEHDVEMEFESREREDGSIDEILKCPNPNCTHHTRLGSRIPYKKMRD
jgi:hypothetical protein